MNYKFVLWMMPSVLPNMMKLIDIVVEKYLMIRILYYYCCSRERVMKNCEHGRMGEWKKSLIHLLSTIEEYATTARAGGYRRGEPSMRC
jgi:hypothetical protein